MTAGVGVDTWVILVVPEAGLERPVLGVVRGVVGTPDPVVDVFAEVGSVRSSWVTGLQAESVAAHEAFLISITVGSRLK